MDFNNGLIIQFGILQVVTVPGTWSGNLTHTLPTSFSHQHFICVIDNANVYNGNNGSTVLQIDRTLTSLVYRCFNTGEITLCYISCGT